MIKPYYILLFVFITFVCAASLNTYTINTSDYFRSIYLFLHDIPSFTSNFDLSFKFKGDFKNIFNVDYKSSYTFILYFYALFLSFFTNYLDLTLLSSILKALYISALYCLFIKASGMVRAKHFPLFVIVAIPMLSSSILSFFSSFYQEQIILLALPALSCLLFASERITYKHAFILVTIIACAKSQFFYAPLLLLFSYFIYDRREIRSKILTSLICMLISVGCVLLSKSTTDINKYHASYFGVYLLMQNNGYSLPEEVDYKCVGIDAWGNKYDIEKGAIATKIGDSCRKAHAITGFSNVLSQYILHPSLLVKLPLDKSLQFQMKEDYIHVFKGIKLISSKNTLISEITNIKDRLYSGIRLPLLIAIMALALIARKNINSLSLFFLSAFGVSQFYISFIGEGYRDFSKHIMPMNFSFDLCVYIGFCIIIKHIYFKYFDK
ncbi:hypothetical protein EIF92_23080 [Escherichia coli O11:H5]|nr:hypothetical protein [Escherichia coli O11:H5]